MSFITDGLKKIWDGARKFVRRVWENDFVRTAVVIGASLFTAGLIGGKGFSAFSGNMAAAGGGIGGFFSAVGSTIATGWGMAKKAASSAWNFLTGTPGQQGQQITQVGQSVSPGGGPVGGLNKYTQNASYYQGLLGKVPAGVGQQVPQGKQGQQQGFLGRMFSWLGSGSAGSSFVLGAISQGAAAWAAKEQYEEERWYKNQATVAGGPAFGGGTDVPIQQVGRPREGALAGQQTPDQFSRQQQQGAPGPQATQIAQPLLNTPTTNVSMAGTAQGQPSQGRAAAQPIGIDFTRQGLLGVL